MTSAKISLHCSCKKKCNVGLTHSKTHIWVKTTKMLWPQSEEWLTTSALLKKLWRSFNTGYEKKRYSNAILWLFLSSKIRRFEIFLFLGFPLSVTCDFCTIATQMYHCFLYLTELTVFCSFHVERTNEDALVGFAAGNWWSTRLLTTQILTRARSLIYCVQNI